MELTPGRRDEVVRSGDLEVLGRMAWSSNATLLVNAALDGVEVRAIYKPVQGERPLWDFEPGLHKREAAAYLLSEATGLHLVPPTVERSGPHGVGSMQLFIEHNPSEHYFALRERDELDEQLVRFAVFDLLTTYPRRYVDRTRQVDHHVLAGKTCRQGIGIVQGRQLRRCPRRWRGAR